ncbi:MAG: (2Fe-2S)-binding protein [Chloroflexi bacterium]|nr:(2Fe-2S)-binding protein [Chloroflexota bacterium]
MTAKRIKGIERGAAITIKVNGSAVSAHAGESVAAALAAAGFRAVRKTEASGSPRGLFCGMGMCYDCLATIDGIPNTRTCLAEVREGLEIIVDC